MTNCIVQKSIYNNLIVETSPKIYMRYKYEFNNYFSKNYTNNLCKM